MALRQSEVCSTYGVSFTGDGCVILGCKSSWKFSLQSWRWKEGEGTYSHSWKALLMCTRLDFPCRCELFLSKLSLAIRGVQWESTIDFCDGNNEWNSHLSILLLLRKVKGDSWSGLPDHSSLLCLKEVCIGTFFSGIFCWCFLLFSILTNENYCPAITCWPFSECTNF